MIAEALQWIKNQAPVMTFRDGERLYADKDPKPVKAPMAEGFVVTSLASVADLMKGLPNMTPQIFALQVSGHNKVEVVTQLVDVWGRRQIAISATPPSSQEFKFGQWYDQETFIIALQSLFEGGADLDYVLNLANNITTGKVTTSEDDGVTQRVTVKKGAALKEVKEMKRRVSLAPFRTFREVVQPSSEFVFRVKQVEDEVPVLALFEADGGKWKLDAAAAVKTWLGEKLSGYLIVA